VYIINYFTLPENWLYHIPCVLEPLPKEGRLYVHRAKGTYFSAR